MSGSLEEDLLVAGVGDWVHFGEVAWLAAQRGAQPGREDQIAATLAALRNLQERGLMEIGDVGPDGFTAWHVPIDEVEERVREAWFALDRDPVPGDIGWLANTPLGDQAGQ
jgi:hypothetical protein